MGDGLTRAVGLQIAGAVDSVLIVSATGTTAYTSGEWCELEVISSEAAFAGIVAPGLANAAGLTSDVPLPLGSRVRCSKITAVKLSSDATGHKIIAHTRVLR